MATAGGDGRNVRAARSWTWQFPCKLVRVIDGDTLILELDHGCRIKSTQRVRLLGIDAPERNTPEGVRARTFISNWMAWPWPGGIRVATEKDAMDPFGRWLATIVATDKDGYQISLADGLVAAGLAAPKIYASATPDSPGAAEDSEP